jgi:hypothetical protein
MYCVSQDLVVVKGGNLVLTSCVLDAAMGAATIFAERASVTVSNGGSIRGVFGYYTSHAGVIRADPTATLVAVDSLVVLDRTSVYGGPSPYPGIVPGSAATGATRPRVYLAGPLSVIGGAGPSNSSIFPGNGGPGVVHDGELRIDRATIQGGTAVSPGYANPLGSPLSPRELL